jgi:hypothetical protein
MSCRIIHVIPADDEREHQLSTWCWCGPESFEVDAGGATIWVHHAADLREAYEQATGEAFQGKTWTRVEVEEE